MKRRREVGISIDTKNSNTLTQIIVPLGPNSISMPEGKRTVYLLLR